MFVIIFFVFINNEQFYELINMRKEKIFFISYFKIIN